MSNTWAEVRKNLTILEIAHLDVRLGVPGSGWIGPIKEDCQCRGCTMDIQKLQPSNKTALIAGAILLPAIGARLEFPGIEGIKMAGLWLTICGLSCVARLLSSGFQEWKRQ